MQSVEKFSKTEIKHLIIPQLYFFDARKVFQKDKAVFRRRRKKAKNRKSNHTKKISGYSPEKSVCFIITPALSSFQRIFDRLYREAKRFIDFNLIFHRFARM